ncbi:hypothetical protein HanIR_Chr15g0751081 [Helianthus annuus]|nr:hypothetical protein HanIR_Chr15g0751081 [Helianthus annuus]
MADGNLLMLQSTRLSVSKLQRLPRKEISSVNEHERRESVRSVVVCPNVIGSLGIPMFTYDITSRFFILLYISSGSLKNSYPSIRIISERFVLLKSTGNPDMPVHFNRILSQESDISRFDAMLSWLTIEACLTFEKLLKTKARTRSCILTHPLTSLSVNKFACMRFSTQTLARILASIKVCTLANKFNPHPYIIKSSTGILKSSGNKPLRRKIALSSSLLRFL